MTCAAGEPKGCLLVSQQAPLDVLLDNMHRGPIYRAQRRFIGPYGGLE
jgi:hypothetical protein